MSENLIRLTYRYEKGEPGVDEDQKNLLSRAVGSCLREGKTIRSAFLATFRADEDAPLRWLGAFVHTDRGFILFIPGFRPRPTSLGMIRGQTRVGERRLQIDHISLNPDRQQWHLTTPGSLNHQRGGSTRELDDERLIWCGLSVPGPEAFPKVKEKTRITAAAPKSDLKRRAQHINERLLDETPAMDVELHPKDRGAFGSSELLHMALVVGAPGSDTYGPPDDPFHVPYVSPAVTPPQDWRSSPSPPLRTHQASLDSSVEIQVAACRIPAQLSADVVLTSG